MYFILYQIRLLSDVALCTCQDLTEICRLRSSFPLFCVCLIYLSLFLSLCRMKDTSRKNNMFAQFRKNERDKQKLIDTVVKQLRNLIASHQS